MLIRDLCLPEPIAAPLIRSSCENTAATYTKQKGTPVKRASRSNAASLNKASQSISLAAMTYDCRQGDESCFFSAFSSTSCRHPGQYDNLFNTKASLPYLDKGFQDPSASGYEPVCDSSPEHERGWVAKAQSLDMPDWERQRYMPHPVDLTFKMASHHSDRGMKYSSAWQNSSQHRVSQHHLDQKCLSSRLSPKQSALGSCKQQNPQKSTHRKFPTEISDTHEAPLQEPQGPVSFRQGLLPLEKASPRMPSQEWCCPKSSLPSRCFSQGSSFTEPRSQDKEPLSEGKLTEKPLSQETYSQYVSLSSVNVNIPRNTVDMGSRSYPQDTSQIEMRQNGIVIVDDSEIDSKHQSEVADDPRKINKHPAETVRRFRESIPKKRPASDSEEAEEGEGLRPAHNGSNCGTEYACPFYKRNRPKYFAKRSCRLAGWPSVHRVKEHLYRHHMHTVCDRCASTFKDQDELRDHIRQPTPCQVSARKVAEDAGFGQDVEKKLRSRKKIEGQSESDKWAHMFRILFPSYENKPTPSPVVDYEASSNTRPRAAALPQAVEDPVASTFASVHESIANALSMVTAVAEQQQKQKQKRKDAEANGDRPTFLAGHGEGPPGTDSAEAPVSEATKSLYESSMSTLTALAEEFQTALSALPPPSAKVSATAESRLKKRSKKEQ